ncbi:MAG: MBL fold metallo-hydrolase [Xanthobacteraceae bacterium]
MAFYICTACGTQHAESEQPPIHCAICEEERQYIPPRGQTWTTLNALRQSHTNTFREYEKAIIGIGSIPAFAIGQSALLVHTEHGNILWDCIATLDDATVTMIEGLGGIDAIAISHPHQWIMRNDPAIELWDGETKALWDGVTLVRCGGHFEGGAVLHWAGGAGGRGVVCVGDILTVATDRKWLSFMRSYPNFIPLSARAVHKIGAALKPFAFETIYGHYFDRVIAKDGKAVLEASVARYVAAIEGKRGYE